MSNNPFKPEYVPESKADLPRRRPERDDDWPTFPTPPLCALCGVPMGRGYLTVATTREVESRATDLKFCSDRCLQRRLAGLSADDDRAVSTLQERVHGLQDEVRQHRRYERAVGDHYESVRAAFREIVKLLPGLDRGVLTPAPAGQVLAQRVSAFVAVVKRPPTPEEFHPDMRV